jgi:WD domain, G-beta repeat.
LESLNLYQEIPWDTFQFFWLETGEVIQQCKAHKASVISLVFDSTKVVTSGMDFCLKVIDITSCQILHTLRDFEQPVACLRFDSGRITTLSKDGFLKYWFWENNSSGSGRNDHGDGYFYHTLSDGETLSTVCELYGITFATLIKLNGNKGAGAIDMKNVRAGVTLKVGSKNFNNQQDGSSGQRNATNGMMDVKRDEGTSYNFRNHRAFIYNALDRKAKETNLETIVTYDIRSEPTSLASRLEKASESK